jgi:hypothetical protein
MATARAIRPEAAAARSRAPGSTLRWALVALPRPRHGARVDDETPRWPWHMQAEGSIDIVSVSHATLQADPLASCAGSHRQRVQARCARVFQTATAA